MLEKRLIPVLLIQEGGLVKTTRFKESVYIGDPINAVRIFNEKEVDELVVLDIDATKNKKEPDYNLLEKIASEAFMPMGYGGGISNRLQVKQLLRLGFEKVIINSALFNQPNLLKSLSDEFGASSIVASIDVRKSFLGRPEVYIAGGTKKQGGNLLEICKKLEADGAGELLLQSIDRDGTMKGYDLALIEPVAASLSIPVIACGGAGNLEHVSQASRATSLSAFAAGSMFVFHGPHKAVLISYPGYQGLQTIF